MRPARFSQEIPARGKKDVKEATQSLDSDLKIKKHRVSQRKHGVDSVKWAKMAASSQKFPRAIRRTHGFPLEDG
jgi:hypothetical protein